MAKKDYNWADGAELDEHTKRKHKILKEYFSEYLVTRCMYPRREKFRLALVDGFSGAGVYNCGAYGSPLIFLKVLNDTSKIINIQRAADGMRPVEIECYILYNDSDQAAVRTLENNTAGLIADIKANNNKLHIKVEYLSKKFSDAYPIVKQSIQNAKYPNVLFNLDQCGYSKVNIKIVEDIMSSWSSVETFLTFSINTIKTYLSIDENKNSVLMGHPELRKDIYSYLEDGGEVINKKRLDGFCGTGRI